MFSIKKGTCTKGINEETFLNVAELELKNKSLTSLKTGCYSFLFKIYAHVKCNNKVINYNVIGQRINPRPGNERL